MEGPDYAVEESGKTIVVEIVLDISIIRTAENVEHAGSDTRMLILDWQSDLSQELIDRGVRQACLDINYRPKVSVQV